MIGNFNLPLDKSSAKTFVFTAGSNINQGTVWSGLQRWEKPKGINFIYGMIISAASGGGGGGTLGGGGGGTPGTYYTFLQPAFLVPDYLYISVGRGGAGGAAGSNGGFPNAVTGLLYNAASIPGSVASTRLQYIYLSVGSGTQSGRGGTSGAAGAGGTAITYSTTVQVGTYGFSNINIATPSSTGFNGGLTTAGTDAPFLGRPQGGAGGGGRSGGAKAGGLVVQPSGGPFSNIGKRFGGNPNGSKGDDGITLFEPTLFFTPGAGGGANDAGAGGKGGDGGIGCGGGGGGAGSTTGGAGGNGGDGLIILICW